MPQQRMDIRMIKDILRLKYQGGLSHERIARSLSISKGVVAKYLSLAGAAGLDWPATVELDEAALERRLLGRSAAETRLIEADFAHVHIELRRKGVTLVLLWQEYRAANDGRRTWAYTQFCEHYKAFAKSLKRSMRQHRRAGEKLFIDYAGPTLALADGTRAQVFIAAMGASSYTFACATVDQSMRSWLGALARALSFYGGCPQLIVPDNPRSLVSEACRYEPKLNATVRQFARHYDVSFLPARPYSPKDKALTSCCTSLRRLSGNKSRGRAAVSSPVAFDVLDISQRFIQAAMVVAVKLALKQAGAPEFVDRGGRHAELAGDFINREHAALAQPLEPALQAICCTHEADLLQGEGIASPIAMPQLVQPRGDLPVGRRFQQLVNELDHVR